MTRKSMEIDQATENQILDVFQSQIKLRKTVNIKECVRIVYGTSKQGGTHHAIICEVADKHGFPRKILNKQRVYVSTNHKEPRKSGHFHRIDVLADWVLNEVQS